MRSLLPTPVMSSSAGSAPLSTTWCSRCSPPSCSASSDATTCACACMCASMCAAVLYFVWRYRPHASMCLQLCGCHKGKELGAAQGMLAHRHVSQSRGMQCAIGATEACTRLVYAAPCVACRCCPQVPADTAHLLRKNLGCVLFGGAVDQVVLLSLRGEVQAQSSQIKGAQGSTGQPGNRPLCGGGGAWHRMVPGTLPDALRQQHDCPFRSGPSTAT